MTHQVHVFLVFIRYNLSIKYFTLNMINNVNTKHILLYTVKQRNKLFLQAIQRRVNGVENFNRNWTEYKLGFGSPYVDYWIGNDVIHQLTNGRNSSLRVTITPMNGGSVSFKMYHQFYVFGEDQNYKLQLAMPGNGTLDDCLLYYNYGKLTGMQFSTFDVDNDNSAGNCVLDYYGGWWFDSCYYAFLNGQWLSKSWLNPWWTQYQSGTDVNGTSMLIK